MKQSNRTALESLTKIVQEHIEAGHLDRRSLEILHRVAIKHQNRKDRESGGYTSFDYISLEFAITAYQYILENGGQHHEALEYAVDVHGKTGEWLGEAKKRQYFHSKEVVKAHDDHPEQKVMIKNGTMDRGDLMRTKTITGQLKKLARQKKLSDEMEGMKAKLEEQRNDLEYTKAQGETFENGFEELEAKGLVSKKDKKKLAARMKRRGISQKVIMDYLDISLPTIKRWWKELDNYFEKSEEGT